MFVVACFLCTYPTINSCIVLCVTRCFVSWDMYLTIPIAHCTLSNPFVCVHAGMKPTVALGLSLATALILFVGIFGGLWWLKKRRGSQKRCSNVPLLLFVPTLSSFPTFNKCNRLYTNLQVSPISDNGVCVCFHAGLATPPLERSTQCFSQDRAALVPGLCWSASPSLWRLRLLKSLKRLSLAVEKYYPVDTPQRWEPLPVHLHGQVRKRWSSD